MAPFYTRKSRYLFISQVYTDLPFLLTVPDVPVFHFMLSDHGIQFITKEVDRGICWSFYMPSTSHSTCHPEKLSAWQSHDMALKVQLRHQLTRNAL